MRAQEREVREGCAGDVIGEIAVRVVGRGERLLGKRMGDVNGLGAKVRLISRSLEKRRTAS